MAEQPEPEDGRGTDRRPVTVFISYAHENYAHVRRVERVAKILAARGMKVFLDNWCTRRIDWNEVITGELSNSDYIIAVASPGFHAAAEGTAPPGRHGAVRHE